MRFDVKTRQGSRIVENTIDASDRVEAAKKAIRTTIADRVDSFQRQNRGELISPKFFRWMLAKTEVVDIVERSKE